MKVKWMSIIDDLRGKVGGKHYARRIPGNIEWAALCEKPELSKETKKKKAEHITCKNFTNYISESSKILNDPVRRANWEAKYEAARRKANRYGKPIQGRLVDYVRHEVNLAIKEGREIE